MRGQRSGRGMNANGWRPRGFSLIEVLTAIVIIGIGAALVGPRVASSTRRVQLDGAAQQLLGDLEHARTEAIKRNQSVTLKKTGTSSYTITTIGARSLSGASFASGADSVRFAPFGPPTTGAASFTLTANGNSKTVSVNAAGYASVQ